ncbi:nephrin-like [Limulus polyphemus]|uniref:Nephrin-like n=1 Tax=Limulus polyphemus TaxID=6850 RepID=A0ABM1S4W4_LIMPO|nr:nephrin-like [Limulus polyphemus]
MPSRWDNGKYLSCRVDNPFVRDSALEDGLTLNVTYVPVVTLSVGGEHKNHVVHESDDVFLNCDFQANPRVSTVQWYFQDEEISGDPEMGIVLSNQTLLLFDIKKERRGLYSCDATNTEGRGRSLDIELNIKYKPECVAEQKQTYYATTGEIVEVFCLVTADPPEVTFTWMFNNSKHHRELLSFVSSGTHSIAKVRLERKEDFGTLTCKAKNLVGIQEEPCRYVLVQVYPPDPVTNCTVINSTEHDLILDCLPGHNGGLHQEFHLEVYDSGDRSLQINITNDTGPVFHLATLSSGGEFILLVYSANSKGQSVPVQIIAEMPVATHWKQGRSATSAFRPLLGAVLSFVMLLLLILLCVVIFVHVKRFRRQKGSARSCHTDEQTSHISSQKSSSKDGTSSDPDIIPMHEDPSQTFITSLNILPDQEKRKDHGVNVTSSVAVVNQSPKEFVTSHRNCMNRELLTSASLINHHPRFSGNTKNFNKCSIQNEDELKHFVGELQVTEGDTQVSTTV